MPPVLPSLHTILAPGATSKIFSVQKLVAVQFCIGRGQHFVSYVRRISQQADSSIATSVSLYVAEYTNILHLPQLPCHAFVLPVSLFVSFVVLK